MTEQPTNSFGFSKIALIGLLLAAAIWGGRLLRQSWEALDRQPTDKRSLAVTPSSVHTTRAEILYLQHCERCHGPQGHGNGEGLRPLSIQPRDFHGQHWRFEKSQRSIETVIREGIPGTSMPAMQSSLATDDITQLASFVIRLANADSPTDPPESQLKDAIFAAGFSPVVSAKLPDINLTSVNGQGISLSGFQDKPLIVHFWGTSCVHCLREMPNLDRLIQELQEDVTVVSICADQNDPTEIQSFASDYEHLTFFVDQSGLAMPRFSASLLPTFYLVDPHGTIIATRQQNLPADPSFLRKLLSAIK